jgi:hypothetical protein
VVILCRSGGDLVAIKVHSDAYEAALGWVTA